ncbi:hypothetical protein [Pseudomonas cerasi]
MQRLTSAAPIDDSTLATYEETVAIIQRYLPPSLALVFATTRRSSSGHLEWWTARQGLAQPLSALSEDEQRGVQSKLQNYRGILAGLIEQLIARGEEQPARALQQLLIHSQTLDCYAVGSEPVLVNWVIVAQETPHPVMVVPWWKRALPWLLLTLLLLILLALAWWWYHHRAQPAPVIPAPREIPAVVAPTPPSSTELTQDNPSINFAKRKDFGRIKINLTWKQGQHQQPVDLDIAAFIRFKNGDISGVEALSHAVGDYENPPYIQLKEDLRDGNIRDGEWLYINGRHWQEMDEVLIYSFIFGGASNWQGTDATITVYVPGQPPISTTLTDGDQRNNVAAIARLKNVDGEIKVERLSRFFPEREPMDKYYGWGFKWKPGASKN